MSNTAKNLSSITARNEPEIAQVTEASHITLHYQLTLQPDNAIVMSTFDTRPATLQMGLGQLAEPLERRLIGLSEGASHTFDLPAGEAFGPRNPQLLQKLSRKVFDANLASSAVTGADGQDKDDFEIGDLLEFPRPDGGRYAGVLKELNEHHALIDFNHPLAGQTVRFEVKILGVL